MAQRAAPLRVVLPALIPQYTQSPHPGTRKKVRGNVGSFLRKLIGSDLPSTPHMPDVPTLSTLVKSPLMFIVADAKMQKIGMFLLLSTAFMAVEFVYGFHSNSLGLISDACHMLFDCAALAIGLYASYISKLQANPRYNYGYGRFEVISGYMNAVFLILVASLIVLESLERILDPPEISTESLLLVSTGGFLVNVVGLIFFHEAHHHHHGDSCGHGTTHSHKEKSSPLPTFIRDKGVSSPLPTFIRDKGVDLQVVKVETPRLHDGEQGRHSGIHHGHLHGADDHSVHSFTDPAYSNLEQGTSCTNGHCGHDPKHENHIQDLHNSHLDLNQHSWDHGQDHGHDHGHGHADVPDLDQEQGHGHGHGHTDVHDHGHHHGHIHKHDYGHDHEHEHKHDHTDHNMQGMFLHILADTLGSVGVVVSSLLIKYKGWYFTDPACSMIISALIIASVIPLVRSSAEMLLQRMPRATESRIQHAIKQVEALDGVWSCQALHIWNFTNAEVVASLHLLAYRGTDKEQLRTAVAYLLKKAGITDLTLQVETV